MSTLDNSSPHAHRGFIRLVSILFRLNPGDDPTEHPEHDNDRKGEEKDE
jgi:hypothetical protein